MVISQDLQGAVLQQIAVMWVFSSALISAWLDQASAEWLLKVRVSPYMACYLPVYECVRDKENSS